MKYLLDNQFAPLSFAWGFVESPLPEVANFVSSWRGQLNIPTDVEPVEARLADALIRLEPLTLPPRRHLLLSTHSAWTALFDNSANGGDPAPVVSYVSRMLRCRGLAVCSKPQTWSPDVANQLGVESATKFTVFSPQRTEWLNVQRHISLSRQDGKWKFFATGEMLPFEHAEAYSLKKPAERFSSELLELYCRSLGIELFDPAFYGPQGILLVMRLPLAPGQTCIPLEEARTKLGLEGRKHS